MIRRWIQELRHKPKPVRDRVALSIAGSATAFVFLAWLYVTPGKLGEVATEVREQPGTFSLLFDRVREQTAAVVDGVNAFNRDGSIIVDCLFSYSCGMFVKEPSVSVGD